MRKKWSIYFEIIHSGVEINGEKKEMFTSDALEVDKIIPDAV